MRFGCCVGLELLDTAAEVGYDFAELSASALVPEDDEACFRPVIAQLAGAPIKAEAWRLDLPADLRACGPAVDWPRLSRYVNTALRRAAAAQGAVIGFPCGECCDVPPGVSMAEAAEQLRDLLRVCGVVARSRGLVVGVEGLPGSKSHLVGSVPDAIELARRVNMPEVGVLPNCEQIAGAGHSLLDIADAAAWLAHVHVPAVESASASAEDILRETAEALRLADYDGRVSVQADWDHPKEDMARTLESLHRCFERP
jgi:sugar phosphate isomerase/epimerase